MTLDRNMIASIRRAMQRVGLESYSQLADEINMRKATVTEILNGKRDPRLSTVQKMARACKCSLSELLGEK